MIWKIHRTRRLKESIIYNENKVRDKVAELLDAGFYIKEAKDLTLDQKLSRLQNRALLNDRAKVTAVLFTLGFDSTYQLSGEQLKRISGELLKSVGLVNHPYLLYEHRDTASQHVHIISTLIREDGSRVSSKELSLALILKTCKSIEAKFGLKSYKSKFSYEGQADQIQNGQLLPSKILSIRQAVNRVLSEYKFSTISEYKAILKMFGVKVSSGNEGSRLFAFGGLVYNTLDRNGKPTGKAIKASRVSPDATLKALTLKFGQDETERLAHLTRLKNSVDLCVINQGTSMAALAQALKASGIEIHVIKETQEKEPRFTYVDKRTKTAFDATTLGEKYSLKGLNQRCKKMQDPVLKRERLSHHSANHTRFDPDILPLYTAGIPERSRVDMLLADLLAAHVDYNVTPYELRNCAKKKRRKRSGNHL